MSVIIAREKLLREIERSKLRKVIADTEYFASMDPLEALAIHLHDHMCKRDHNGWCNWNYEVKDHNVHDWGRETHKKWLNSCKPLHDNLLAQNISVDNYLQILLLTPIN